MYKEKQGKLAKFEAMPCLTRMQLPAPGFDKPHPGRCRHSGNERAGGFPHPIPAMTPFSLSSLFSPHFFSSLSLSLPLYHSKWSLCIQIIYFTVFHAPTVPSSDKTKDKSCVTSQSRHTGKPTEKTKPNQEKTENITRGWGQIIKAKCLGRGKNFYFHINNSKTKVELEEP